MTLALFLSLLIKSGLVAGAGLAAAHWIGRTAADRVDILRATVCVLLALPVIAALLPSLQLAILPAPAVPAVAVDPLWAGEIGPVAGMEVSGALPPPSPALIAAVVWILGAVAIVGRFVIGLVTLDRWTREGRVVTAPAWLAPLARLSPSPRPRLVSSDRLSSPLSWGVSPGVIVVDPASLDAAETAPAVLAHELAHLKRRDWVFLILSRLAVALFWFNPLVWRLHAVLAARSEEAADAEALRTVDAPTYARALVRLAACPPTLSHAATPMAANTRTLKRRIACIMSASPNRRRPLAVALSVAALAVVATPLAALEIREHGFDAPPLPSLPAMAALVAPLPPIPPMPPMPPMVQSGEWSAPPAPPAAPPAPAAPPTPPVPDQTQWSMSAPPAPPALPAPPATPAPPAPPAPPVERVYTYGSTTWREATPEEQRAAAAARAEAVVARREGAQARQQAQAARIQAGTDRTAARAQADAARARADQARGQADIARAQSDQARVQAEHARAGAEVARQQATRSRADARVQMGNGARQMRNGADQMREEAVRLRDPAYRARQIAQAREQGRTVTDAELLDLSSRLPARADEMERRADEMQRRAAGPA
jgi:beta-lactamase regulating signal transducer with metallopeptidase domain